MKFTIEVPDEIIHHVSKCGVTRKQMGKFLRDEVRKISHRYGNVPDLQKEKIPGETKEWRAYIFNDIRAQYQRERIEAVVIPIVDASRKAR